MTKIAFIGGGSVQWTPGLTNDLALTPELAGTQLVLHDIDPRALQRLTPLCKRIVAWHEAEIDVRATLDLREALSGADFAILCVSVGGLAAMGSDLEIPEAYGIRQSVGDTVGPGGLARGLRHIPLALRVARQMEEVCPDAWLLNLTNPMATLCRAVTRATGIRTVGLCHEVAGVRRGLASLLDLPVEQVLLEVAGINHLPAITRCAIDGQDGLALLADWLSGHDPFELVPPPGPLPSAIQVFDDHWAVKLSLFQASGVLYGAGDRHVAEFFPGFLNKRSGYGDRYGVVLTTVAHRQEIHRQRVAELDHYRPPPQRSDEQLAPLMAALLGGPPGQFVLNLPNVGQIDNLPRQAVVECLAYADGLGITPLATGPLPPAAHAVIAGHIDRQELIVEAALTGEMDAARAALSGDPLVHDPTIAAPLFEALMAANATAAAPLAASEQERQRRATEMAQLSAQTVSAEAVRQEKARQGGGLRVAHSTLRELLDDPAARQILEARFAGLLDHPQLQMALDMTLRQIAPFVPDILTEETLASMDEQLCHLGQAGAA